MKTLFKFVLSIVFTLMTSMAYAHPASDVQLKFDPQSRILSVEIKHQVSDPALHYIDRVIITLNGQPSISHSLTIQDAAAGETLSYFMPDVKNGDVIEADSHCNKGGTLQKSLAVQM